MLSIIIVNYNSFEYTTSCIDSIINSNLKDIIIEIIIVDNNSQFKKNLESIHRSVSYFQLKNNIGYSKALNYGIKQSSGDFILTVNPDVIVGENSIKYIMEYYLRASNPGIVGPKVLNINSTFQLSSRRRFPYFKYIIPYYLKFHYLGFENLYNYSNISHNIIHSVDSISGSFMFFSRTLFNDVNGFDEQFFLYFEDTDFCLKAKKKGYDVVYYPDSIITHIKYGSTSYRNYFFVRFHFYKSFVKFYIKYFDHYFKLI